MPVTQNNRRINTMIENRCYKCSGSYSSPSYLIHHMEKVHNIKIPARQPGINNTRPASTTYNYTKNGQPFHRKRLGCPSCWFHCADNESRLKIHIEERHIDSDMNEGYETPDDDGDYSEEEEVQDLKENMQNGNNTDVKITADEKAVFSQLFEIMTNFTKLVINSKK